MAMFHRIDADANATPTEREFVAATRSAYQHHPEAVAYVADGHYGDMLIALVAPDGSAFVGIENCSSVANFVASINAMAAGGAQDPGQLHHPGLDEYGFEPGWADPKCDRFSKATSTSLF